jgi:hypothetical protein
LLLARVQFARQQELLGGFDNDFGRGSCRLGRVCHRREVEPRKVECHVKGKCWQAREAQKKCESGGAECGHISPLILDRFVIEMI